MSVLTDVGLNQYLSLAIVLFSIGLYGVLTRRNAVAILMSIELMFNAVNISLVAFTRFQGQSESPLGQMFALFIIAVAAAEVTIGVALVLSLYRNFHHINVEEVDLLKW
jgi:NADH:ubiquinone oxidoreductase subunit K